VRTASPNVVSGRARGASANIIDDKINKNDNKVKVNIPHAI